MNIGELEKTRETTAKYHERAYLEQAILLDMSSRFILYSIDEP